MFYNLYDGKNRREFENELFNRFGSVVKMPLLKSDREPLPDSIKLILEEGLSLFRLHSGKHGRLEPSKGSYKREWIEWEKRLRSIIFQNSNYLNSIQVPFDIAVKEVLEQLQKVAKGEHGTPNSVKRRFGNIVFAAVTLQAADIKLLLNELASKNPKAKQFLITTHLEEKLDRVHVTLAHKRSHGVTAVARYGIYQEQEIPIEFTALFFMDKLAALEARLGSVNGERIESKNEWPHATLWTAQGIPPREANTLPLLYSEGKATRIDIIPPFTVNGILDFY